MKRHAARFAVTIALATLVLGMFATNAFAAITDVPIPAGESATNPGALDGADSWWRSGWGLTASPQYKLNTPSVDSFTKVTGFYYLVDSSKVTTLGPLFPASAMNFSAMPTGTHMGGTLDLQASLLYAAVTGGHPLEPGATSPIEGHWYFHYIFVDNRGEWGTPLMASLGVDNTKPAAVTGLKASPNDGVWAPGAVSPTSRVKLTWDLNQYDSLSGVAYYQVLIDGKPVIPESATSPTQGRVYELLPDSEGRNMPVVGNSVTIENAPVGTHTYSIACVDRATNEGPVASVTFTTDPDVPVASWTAPMGNYIGLNQEFGVNATDTGGIRSVSFALDGVTFGTTTASPYSMTVNMGAFANGPHTLTAAVTDKYGRVVTLSKPVTLDKNALTITRFSRSPAVFYPIRRDRYLDNSYIYFTNNKTATVTLTVRNSSGTAVRVLKMAAAPGAHKFVWDGRWASDRRAHTGTYTYQITAVDASGFTAQTGKLSTIIRNYELKRISRNMIRVIPR